MKPLICDMCGSGDIVKVDNLFVCQSCGTKYSIEAAKKMMISGQVEVVNVVNTVNHDFKSKLALADIKAKFYFEKGPMSVDGTGLSEDLEYLKGYDAVIAFYDNALKEGYDQSIGWAKLARFYLNANFQGFQNKTRGVIDNKSFTDQYDFYMNNAINYAPTLDEKNAYKIAEKMIQV